MTKIKSCEFNHDTACVDIIFDNGENISLYTVEIENQLEADMAGRSKMDWLIYNETLTYAQLILSSEMQDYLGSYSKSYHRTESGIRKTLKSVLLPNRRGKLHESL